MDWRHEGQNDVQAMLIKPPTTYRRNIGKPFKMKKMKISQQRISTFLNSIDRDNFQRTHRVM